MCYNCGCGSPKDDHGQGHMGVDPDGKAITDKSFEAASQAFSMDMQTSKKNVSELLEDQ